jgi:hypothetical protein
LWKLFFFFRCSLDIELWSKEAPLACRNFVQLCLEGYYNHTQVVRIVKGFMVQMGKCDSGLITVLRLSLLLSYRLLTVSLFLC